MDCVNKNKNTKDCSCTYPSCPRKGVCCECIKYHVFNDELPGCFFPSEAERTFDRSREYYMSVYKER